MECHIVWNKKTEETIAAKARQKRTVLKKVGEDDSINQEAHKRDQIKRDRLDKHRRKRNIVCNNPEKLHKFKKNHGRDIGERIALGLLDHHEIQINHSKG
uniref:Uncharacterized protein n=1 Tax=Onchocerca volvulus TaxID=6282 RepID=A0A8R1Y6F0_ONCVO